MKASAHLHWCLQSRRLHFPFCVRVCMLSEWVINWFIHSLAALTARSWFLRTSWLQTCTTSFPKKATTLATSLQWVRFTALCQTGKTNMLSWECSQLQSASRSRRGGWRKTACVSRFIRFTVVSLWGLYYLPLPPPLLTLFPLCFSFSCALPSLQLLEAQVNYHKKSLTVLENVLPTIQAQQGNVTHAHTVLLQRIGGFCVSAWQRGGAVLCVQEWMCGRMKACILCQPPSPPGPPLFGFCVAGHYLSLEKRRKCEWLRPEVHLVITFNFIAPLCFSNFHTYFQDSFQLRSWLKSTTQASHIYEQ